MNSRGYLVLSPLARSLASGINRPAALDALDGTPVLDIKPYAAKFDSYPNEKAGRLDNESVDKKIADERFDKNPE